MGWSLTGKTSSLNIIAINIGLDDDPLVLGAGVLINDQGKFPTWLFIGYVIESHSIHG